MSPAEWWHIYRVHEVRIENLKSIQPGGKPKRGLSEEGADYLLTLLDQWKAEEAMKT